MRLFKKKLITKTNIGTENIKTQMFNMLICLQ
jgi:hypothetical protein